MSSSSKPSTAPAPRGTSCQNCRWCSAFLSDFSPFSEDLIQQKCDWKKPVCDVCKNSTLPLGDCEYPEGRFSQADILQEKISILETRLEELQTPSSASGSLRLTDPWAKNQTTSSGSSASSKPKNGARILNDFQSGPPERRRSILDTFLKHSSEVGFFLEPTQFTSAFLSSGNDQQPTLTLVSIVLLFNVYFEGSGTSESQEAEHFVYATESHSRLAFSGSHPKVVLYTIQANVLLAHYLLLKGKALEGKYYLVGAVSLVLSTGLHRTRTSDPTRSRAATFLPAPRDAIGEGERINAVWAVVALNACWTTAERHASNLDYNSVDGRIDAPWPMDIARYAKNSFPTDFRTSHTIQKFLTNQSDEGYSTLALYAKASILFEQASALYYQYRPNMDSTEARRYSFSCDNLNSLLARFTSELRPPEAAKSLDIQRRLLVVHLLSKVASIQLHYAFVASNASSYAQVLSTANSVVEMLKTVDLKAFEVVDPIVAILLKVVGKVFIAEIANARSSRNEIGGFIASYKCIIDAMSVLGAGRCTLMEKEAALLREKYTSVVSR
ncbi:hypothetical protein WG66_009606 [Moniliophthora roreri]|nr:hypothetical protein WG66_009606 [Moniliophthora roreri]